MFQFTLPHGERLWVVFKVFGIRGFQFTLPHGERLAYPFGKYWTNTFQFTLPHGERQGRGAPPEGRRCFNSRSRMGSDRAEERRRKAAGVSIHAPAWGATRGCRLPSASTQVSIHAPAWGATAARDMADYISKFQFTLPHGERHGKRPYKLYILGFQFTLPHGERPRPRRGLSGRQRFNSRSRMGSDSNRERVSILEAVSIHAPAWGATRGRAVLSGRLSVSIHAPAWGAT